MPSQSMTVKCPKCGSNMIPIVYNKVWFCLNDGTEVPFEEPLPNGVIKSDDPALNGWRDYL